jgi:cytochrome c oxidase subunit I+III
MGAACAADTHSLWSVAGLAPSASAWGAAVAAMNSYQGLHLVLLAFIGPWIIARSLAHKLTPGSRAALDCGALIWHYTSLQGAAAIAVIYLMPKLMG